MASAPAQHAVTEHGTYETSDGPRRVLVVQYGARDFAVLDIHVGTQRVDLDERFVESDLPTFDEAEAVARDYLANARAAGKPLARLL